MIRAVNVLILLCPIGSCSHLEAAKPAPLGNVFGKKKLSFKLPTRPRKSKTCWPMSEPKMDCLGDLQLKALLFPSTLILLAVALPSIAFGHSWVSLLRCKCPGRKTPVRTKSQNKQIPSTTTFLEVDKTLRTAHIGSRNGGTCFSMWWADTEAICRTQGVSRSHDNWKCLFSHVRDAHLFFATVGPLDFSPSKYRPQ